MIAEKVAATNEPVPRYQRTEGSAPMSEGAVLQRLTSVALLHEHSKERG